MLLRIRGTGDFCMATEQGVVPRNLVAWLLEKDNPSIRYFALKDLLGKDETDPEVIRARAAIPDSKVVAKILLKQKAEGYWENGAAHIIPSTSQLTGKP